MTHPTSSLGLGLAGLRFCAALTTGSSLAADPPSPAPPDPVIKRADIVYEAAPAFTPQVVLAANGDLIALWNTKGDGMPGQATQFARSSDGGRTWSEPYLTIQSDQPLTGSSAWLYHLPDRPGTVGRMLLYTLEVVWPAEPDQARPDYLSLAAGRKFDSFYSFSQDFGRTFSERKRLSDPVKRDDFAQGHIVQLPNGDLLWPWGYWGPEPLNGFRRSTDGGLTWDPVVRAWPDPPPGHATPLAFNETAAAVCPDGTLVAIARVDTLRDKKFWQITSSDDGQTWTPPRPMEIAGGSPALYCTPQGQLWLAYRDAGLGPGLGLAVSDDRGATWRFLYHLQDPKGGYEARFGQMRYTDEDRQQPWRPAEGVAGYPCFAPLSEREVYVVYHLQSWEKEGFPFYIAGNLLEVPE